MICTRRSHFDMRDLKDEQNAARFARLCYFVGKFDLALQTLVDADYLVEACHFAISLKEIGLISTKQQLLEFLREKDSIHKQQLLSVFKTT